MTADSSKTPQVRADTNTVSLQPTSCAICGPEAPARELYPANFDLDAFNPAVFSARRLPDRIHYRIVQCEKCGLVRSDPVADAESVSQLYTQSSFDYSEELAGLKATYKRFLVRLRKHLGSSADYLEVGCGNGFMLEEAQTCGYSSVRGIEPSTSAVAQADPSVRERIVCDIIHEGVLAGEQFDAIAMFQVFDHLPSPGEVLSQCMRLLRPGGVLLCLNHNVEAFSARMLKDKSPIIDIEHTYLYSPATLSRLLTDRGFQVVEAGGLRNSYSLYYLFRLIPIPRALKARILHLIECLQGKRLRLTVPLGNMFVIARKPEQ